MKNLEMNLPQILPFRKDDLCKVYLNFENLGKTIDYLHNYSTTLFSKFQAFNVKILKLEERMDSEVLKLVKRIENLDSSTRGIRDFMTTNKDKITEMNIKISEDELKINEIEDKIEEFQNEITKNTDMLHLVENTKKNANNIDLLKQTISQLENKIKLVDSKVDKLIESENQSEEEEQKEKEEEKIENKDVTEEKKVEEEVKKEDETNKSIKAETPIRKEKSKTKTKKIDFKDMKNYIDEYLGEFNKEIIENELKLVKEQIHNINEKMKNKSNESENKFKIKRSDSLNEIEKGEQFIISKVVIDRKDEIESLKGTFDNFMKSQKSLEHILEKYNSEQENIKQNIIEINNELNTNKNDLGNLNQNVEDLNEKSKSFLIYEDIKDIIHNIELLLQKYKEMSKIHEINKKDLDLKYNTLNAHINEIRGNQKINALSDNSDKIVVQNSDSDEQKINLSQLFNNINNVILDKFNSISKDFDLSQNKSFIQLLNTIQKNSNEIKLNNQQLSELKGSNGTGLIKPKEIQLINQELINNHKNLKILNKKLIEIANSIGGLDFSKVELEDKLNSINDLENDQHTSMKEAQEVHETITTKIENLSNVVREMNKKLMGAEKKLNFITKDLRDDMRSNLRMDTYKVIEQFKLKLTSFSDRFENELKNKIDKMGLHVFENKLNSKLSIDLKDKLNKNDLKKNNYMINRKIDSLENKISKTLVDTIIDLQMDEAPLIAKKNHNNVELCGSCNRPLYDSMYNKTLDQINQINTNNSTIAGSRNTKIINLKKLPSIMTNQK